MARLKQLGRDEPHVRDHTRGPRDPDRHGAGNVRARGGPHDAVSGTGAAPACRGGKLIPIPLLLEGMVEPEPPAGLDPVQEGIRLFNAEYFFEAHEVLEDLWERGHG